MLIRKSYFLSRRKSFWPIFILSIVFTMEAVPIMHASDTYIAPQAEIFVAHNNLMRSHLIVSGNWLTEKGAFASAWAQYDLEIGLVSYFRRYVFKDPDAQKSKLINFRVGYLQVTDLKDDPNGFDEKRPLAEVAFRVPLGRTWLFDDRNRIEYRIFHNSEEARYRNRLRIERATKIKSFRMTPYATGEVFYPFEIDRWNEVQAAIGIDFPIKSNTVIEIEVMGQFVDSDISSRSLGIVFQKFL